MDQPGWMICRRMREEYKILEIVTGTLRPTKVRHARRINKDSQSKPHSKHELRELKKIKRRGWTTSDIKKCLKNLIKTFWSETFFSYLQLLNNKEL